MQELQLANGQQLFLTPEVTQGLASCWQEPQGLSSLLSKYSSYLLFEYFLLVVHTRQGRQELGHT